MPEILLCQSLALVVHKGLPLKMPVTSFRWFLVDTRLNRRITSEIRLKLPPFDFFGLRIKRQNYEGGQRSNHYNRLQPIAGFWPTFQMAMPEDRLLGIQGLATM